MPVKFWVPVNTSNLNVSDTTTVKDLDVTGILTGVDISDISGLQPALDLKTNKTYVDEKFNQLFGEGSAPGLLDTITEIANALAGDGNVAATLLTTIGQKANSSSLDLLQVIVDSKASSADLNSRLLTKVEESTFNTLSGRVGSTETNITQLRSEIENLGNLNDVDNLTVHQSLTIDGKDNKGNYKFVVEGNSVSDKLVLKKDDFPIMEMSRDSASTGSSIDTVTFNAPVVINDSLTFGSGATIVGSLKFLADDGLYYTLNGNILKNLLTPP